MTTQKPDPSPLPQSSRPWTRMRRLVLVCAIIVTVIALFYAEEDWKGRRVWHQTRERLENNGVVLDWAKFTPPPVADAENIFKAPHMAEWFTKDWPGSNTLFSARWQERHDPAEENPRSVVVGRVEVVSGDAKEGTDELFEALKTFLSESGPIMKGAQGPTLVRDIPTNAHPFAVRCPAGMADPKKAVTQMLTDAVSKLPAGHPRFSSSSAGLNTFSITLDLGHSYTAAQYLELSDAYTNDLNSIRSALQRPYSRMDGNYSRFATRPIPNFVNLRRAAQMYAQRAQCQMLLGHTNDAFESTMMVHNVSKVLSEAPRKPISLVSAMISVAIEGLFVSVVKEGLDLHTWNADQLREIEKTAQETTVMPLLVASLKAERAGVCNSIETYQPHLFGPKRANDYPKDMARDAFFVLGPRGWRYQNMANTAKLIADGTGVYDEQSGITNLTAVLDAAVAVGALGLSPYTIIATRSLPNYIRAWQAAAKTETLLRETELVCVLERFRLAHGSYPEQLQEIAPEYIARIPVDILGQAFKYRRTEGGFELYSIGWNRVDDGGVAGKDLATGDWVWGS